MARRRAEAALIAVGLLVGGWIGGRYAAVEPEPPALTALAPVAPAWSPLRWVEGDDEVNLDLCASRFARQGAADLWLVPVTHVAEAGFYTWVEGLLSPLDVVLYEGVVGAAPEAPVEGASLTELAAALGLVEQPAVEEGRRGWSRADLDLDTLRRQLLAGGADPAWTERALDGVLSAPVDPLKALAAADPRIRAHARYALMNALSLPPERLSANEQILESVVIDARNQAVLAALAGLHTEPSQQIGLLYGAAHAPGLREGLVGLGYQPQGEVCSTAMRVSLEEIGLGHVQLRQLRARTMAARRLRERAPSR